MADALARRGEETKRIDLLVGPLEMALVEEHWFAKLWDLREGVALGQHPLPLLSGLAWLDALLKGQKRIDARHDDRVHHFPFTPRGSAVSGRQTGARSPLAVDTRSPATVFPRLAASLSTAAAADLHSFLDSNA